MFGEWVPRAVFPDAVHPVYRAAREEPGTGEEPGSANGGLLTGFMFERVLRHSSLSVSPQRCASSGQYSNGKNPGSGSGTGHSSLFEVQVSWLAAAIK